MKKILIIDDEPYILLMLKKMLERAGYEVDLAAGILISAVATTGRPAWLNQVNSHAFQISAPSKGSLPDKNDSRPSLRAMGKSTSGSYLFG